MDNGETHRICMMFNAARNAMTKRKEFEYLADGYINSVSFCFRRFPKDMATADQSLCRMFRQKKEVVLFRVHSWRIWRYGIMK